MAIFNIPQKIDEWLTIQFIIFFALGFLVNVFSNGQATLVYLHEDYNLMPIFNETPFFQTYSSQGCQMLQNFTNQTYHNKNFALYSYLFMYWILSPLINFYYAIFVFKKGKTWIIDDTEDLKVRDVNKNKEV